MPGLRDELSAMVSEESSSLDKWLDASAIAAQVVNLEHKRLIKRNKWDTIIKVHRRRRVLLKHLKATKK